MKLLFWLVRYHCLLLVGILSISIGHSATCLSTGSGNWGNAGTWSCGRLPTCGDSVVIQAGHSVTISAQQDLRGCGSNFVLVINGALRFVTGNKLRLACNSRVYILETGSLVPGGGGGSSNELEICNNTVWQASDGTFTGPRCLPSTLTACATVLPIELLYFKSYDCAHDQTCFEWSTANEHRNEGFELEGSSNGIDFRSIIIVPGHGDSHETRVYQVTVANLEDDLYFRLKQKDYDGKIGYSKIIYIKPDVVETTGYHIQPNPSNGQFSILLNGQTKPNKPVYDFKIYSMSGKLVYERSGLWDQHSEELKINTNGKIPKGVYIGRLSCGGNQMLTKIIID